MQLPLRRAEIVTRRLAFVLPDMGGGGVERLTLDLLTGFLERGFAVDLVLRSATGSFMGQVPAEVRVFDLEAGRLREAILPLRRYLVAERPDAVLAAMWPLTTIAVLAAAGLKHRPRLVLSDHCPLLRQYRQSPATIAALRSTVRTSYRFADALIAVSGALGVEIAALAGVRPEQVTTIWNPIPTPLRSAGASPEWGPGKRILAVGALKSAKNFALLIKAFARLPGYTSSTLAILGEGPERENLERLVTTLGLTGRVILPGFTTTPGDWYACADVFVLPSDYEGFGNVLVEALHCGLPVVATDCPHGPAEVLGNGKWGVLVTPGDIAALAHAIAAALSKPVDSARQRARALEFSVERALNAYARAMTG